MTVDEIAQAARRAERDGDMDAYFDLLDAYDAAVAAEARARDSREGASCPYCRCCSERLCHAACMKDSACHAVGSSADFDLSDCPCWREGSAAAQAYLTGAGG